MQQSIKFSLIGAFALTGALGNILGLTRPSLAQIRPDNTLGAERSIITPNVSTKRGIIERIDGGAIRGGNLFHSFSEFNVNSGQRVYFANPFNIDNLISRITGRNLSNIDGTLGVLGNANLFLINPNGIVFGPNARLDIRGSFVASTSDRVLFPDGYAFSAANPDTPPLLTINAPLGLASWLPSAGNISNAGNLSTGQDLALVGANLNLQGQLRAGGNLNLITTNSLTARDSLTLPFIASAGNQLLLQGNQSVDIAALNHPESGLFSGGDMVLRSNGTVIGDTHFSAGRNFRVERLDGSLGSVVSIQDPVFEVAGDFSIADYTGASLQILAGGSVTIPGVVTINAAGEPFNDGTVVLSDGTPLAVNGTTQPTIDIRAGTTQFFGSPAGGTPTSANINIGSIINPGGLVFLTNQFKPNPALLGDISVESISTSTDPLSGLSGGSVVIDSRGKLTFNAIDVSGGDRTQFNGGGNGGDVTLLAKGDIFMPFPSSIYSYGLVGGNITLSSDTAIIQADAPLGTNPSALSWLESATFGPGQGGVLRLTAPSISLGGNVLSTTNGDGQSGDISITANSLVTSQATIASQTYGAGNSGKVSVNADSIALDYTFLGSFNGSPSGGKGGDVEVKTNSLSATTGAQIGSVVFSSSVGDAGNVNVTAQTISLSGFQPSELTGGLFFPAGIFSSLQSGAQGNSGNITITTGSLSLTGAAVVATSSYGVGNAGDITINASDSIQVDGAVFLNFVTPPLSPVQPSAIQSELFTGAIGKGGNLNITTPVLKVTNGGTITASTDGDGNAGSVNITATRSASFDGVASFTNAPDSNRISRAAVLTFKNATGNGGTLTITAPSLSLTNGGQLTAETVGAGDAGSLRVNVSDSLVLDGAGGGILANTSADSTGRGGSIFISNPQSINVRNGAQIAVNSQGTGTAGDIVMQTGSLVLDNQGIISAETSSNTGGNITLQGDDVLVLRRNSRISTSAGTAGAGGDGGNITLKTNSLVAVQTENSDITANAFTGRGGKVDITAEGIFGFTVRSRAELEALLGTSDPTKLDPALLFTSDITAISQANPNLNGEVILRTPGVDPNQGVVNLPSTIVDASKLIARDCSAGGTLAQSRGSLVVTGRGGLPPSPTEQLSGDTVLVGWESLEQSAQSSNEAATVPTQPQSPTQIVEVQALTRRPDGRIVLVAQSPGIVPQDFWNRSVNCSADFSEH